MKLYTKTVCGKCAWVKSEIEQRGLEVEVINMDHDEEAKQKVVDAGFSTAPVLEVAGELIGDVTKIIQKLEQVSA